MQRRQLFSNNAKTKLAIAFSDTDTQFTVLSGEGDEFASIPNGWYFQVITIKEESVGVEIIEVKTRAGDVFSNIVRGQEGTTALSFSSNADVYCSLTAEAMNAIERTKITNVSNAFFDNLGDFALDIQSSRSSTAKSAHGNYSITLGSDNEADTNAVAIGKENIITGNSAVGIGTANNINGIQSVGVGHGITITSGGSVAVGLLCNITTGNSVCVGISCESSDIYSLSAGMQAIASGPTTTALGYGAVASFSGATAIGDRANALNNANLSIGYKAINRVENTHVLVGCSLIRKDDNEAVGLETLNFVGQENTILSKEIDLTQIAADDVVSLVIPALASFYPEECGLVITATDAVTVQPEISFGITGNATALLAQIVTTISTLKSRQRFKTLVSDGGQVTLTASLKVSATATTLKGRFYFKGILIEGE